MAYAPSWASDTMTSWRASSVDPTVAVNSVPSKSRINIGAGFDPQTALGVRHVDNFDDRVTYEASIVSDVPQAVNIKQRGNVIADGYQATHPTNLSPGFLRNMNPTRQANIPAPDGHTDTNIVNVGNGGSVDETMVRPWAGFPLQGTSDAEYANRTNDVVGTPPPHLQYGFLQPNGVRRVMEAALDTADRGSVQPTQPQIARPWDTKLGRWPWTGDKTALARPLTSQPLNFDRPISNALPSPTGAGGPAYMRNDLSVKPLTFRVAPAPWDQGAEGDFVDSGV